MKHITMTTLEKLAIRYAFPWQSTEEDLELRTHKVLTFGDKVLVVVYYYNGYRNPSYIGAVYEHLDDDLSCEGVVGLSEISEKFFEDDGHAIEWAIKEAVK